MNQPQHDHEEKLTPEEEEAWARSWKKGSATWLKTEKELREVDNNKNKSSPTPPPHHHDKETEL